MSILYNNPDFITPNSLTVQSGGTPVGSVSDVQSFSDGNVYQLPEAPGTPGFEIDFDFVNVQKIFGIVSMLRYAGSATHDVTLRIRDYVAAADLELIRIGDTGAIYQYRTILLPSGAAFVSSGAAQLILHHNSAGNASHDVYIDYIALLGRKVG